MNDLQAKSTNTLALCPFCGADGEIKTSYNGYHERDMYTVVCSNLKCEVNYLAMKMKPTEAEAIEAWNTRAERTCHDVKPSLPFFKCDSCGMEDMGGTELWIQDGFYRSQKPNYCPNCGCKVVKQ